MIIVVATFFLAAVEAAEPLWPDAGVPLGEGCAVCFDSGAIAGARVPFGRDPVDLYHAGITARWAPAAPVELRLRYEYLLGRWPDGALTHDSGDLRLAASARLFSPEIGGASTITWPSVWLDWGVKLPNTSDETGLGTDEADTDLRLLLRWRGDRAALTAGAGIAILGDPTALAAQDDALIVLVSGAWVQGRATWLGRIDGRVWSPDNPTDLGLSLGGERGDQLKLGGELSLGGVGGAARWGGRLWLSWAWACGQGGASALVPEADGV